MTYTIPAPRTSLVVEDGGWGLVDRLRAGDRDALAELYAAYAPGVLRAVAARLLGATGRDAQDLAQEVWVRAIRHLPTLRRQGVSVEAWLFTVARNLVRDYVKSAPVRRSTPVADFLDGDRGFEPSAAAGDVVVDAERARVLRDAVAALPAGQRVVMEARFWRGMSVRETADALGLDEGAVKARQYRACRTLAIHDGIVALAGGADG